MTIQLKHNPAAIEFLQNGYYHLQSGLRYPARSKALTISAHQLFAEAAKLSPEYSKRIQQHLKETNPELKWKTATPNEKLTAIDTFFKEHLSPLARSSETRVETDLSRVDAKLKKAAQNALKQQQNERDHKRLPRSLVSRACHIPTWIKILGFAVPTAITVALIATHVLALPVALSMDGLIVGSLVCGLITRMIVKLKQKPYDVPGAAGHSSMQGKRPTFEDADLKTKFEVKGKECNLYAIFDGHDGRDAADYCKEHMPTFIQNEINAQEDLSDLSIYNALKMAFVKLDQQYKNENREGGTTAAVAFVLDGNLWTANVADSRILLVDDQTTRQITKDQKPDDDEVKRGLLKRGAYPFRGRARSNAKSVTSNGFGPGRAIGDHKHAPSGLNSDGWTGTYLSARPKITKTPLSEIKKGTRMIIGCDGVFDVASSDEIGALARRNRHLPPHKLAGKIVRRAYKAGSTDNISALVVQLK